MTKMPPKKIIIVDAAGEDVRESVGDQAEFNAVVGGHEVQFLLDSEGVRIRGFASLVDGGRYTLGTPAPKPQLQDESKNKRRLEDLLAYHEATIETGTSKSSKLLKLRHTEDGTKRCFLCATTGDATNKIEAAHVVQKQDIYATGGEDALYVFDILKGWSKGLGWNRPFKIHDPMNLIWLCHTHNLAFDSHRFGITLTGLDSGVCFCSYGDDYNDLVNSANQRLLDNEQTFFDMGYVSRRAIGLRLFKAQQAGHYLNHLDPHAWETVVRLSAAASMDPNEAQSEGDDQTEFLRCKG